MIPLPSALAPLIDTLIHQDTYPILVGGYVRDMLLGYPCKDIDIEVYNVKNYATLVHILEPFGKVITVGKSFGVIKLSLGGYDIDLSLPRTESKNGPGHRGFNITLNPQLDFATAAKRRDFTINAMGFDLKSNFFLDPYGGRDDLKRNILRCVDKQTFVEDPLRLYRAMQFCARFNLTPTHALMELCQQMVAQKKIKELPKERRFEEFKKLLLKAETPSLGIIFLQHVNALSSHPELQSVYLQQGDLFWNSTLKALDYMAQKRTDTPQKDLVMMLSALCVHMTKKPDTPHDPKAAAVTTEQFLRGISDDKALIRHVTLLVEYHLKPLEFYRQDASDYQIRKLVLTLPLDDLITIAEVECASRHEKQPRAFLAGEWLRKRVKELDARPETLKPLLQGRDLLDAGLTPSEEFKVILAQAYRAQLQGNFDDRAGALQWFRTYLS